MALRGDVVGAHLYQPRRVFAGFVEEPYPWERDCEHAAPRQEQVVATTQVCSLVGKHSTALRVAEPTQGRRGEHDRPAMTRQAVHDGGRTFDDANSKV